MIELLKEIVKNDLIVSIIVIHASLHMDRHGH